MDIFSTRVACSAVVALIATAHLPDAIAAQECAQQVIVTPAAQRYDSPTIINQRSGTVISGNFFNGGAISVLAGKTVSICVTSPDNDGHRKTVIEMDVGNDNNFQIKAYPEIIVGSKFGNHWETSHRYYNRDNLPLDQWWYVVSDNGVDFANLEYLTNVKNLGLPAYTSALPQIDISLDVDEQNVVGAERDVMLESWFYDVSKNAEQLGPRVGNTLNNIVGAGHPGFPAFNNTLLEMMVHIGALSPNDVSNAQNNPGEERLTVALSGADDDQDGIDDALDIDYVTGVDADLDGIADDKFADVQIGEFRYSIWYGTTYVAPLILFSRETNRDGETSMDLTTEGRIDLDWNAFLEFALFEVEPMLQAKEVDWAIGASNPFPAMRSASGAISAVEFGVELQTNAAPDLPYVATINQFDVNIDGVPHGVGIAMPHDDSDGDGYDNLTEFHTDTDPLDAASAPAPLELPTDQWQMLSLPLDAPDGAATVGDIFADDISGSYGQDWRVFQYDAITKRYNNIGLDDTIVAGDGFWIIQSTGQTVWIDMPAGSTAAKTESSPTCGVFSGCIERDLPFQTGAGRWHMFGSGFHAPTPTASIKLKTADGVCADGCDIAEQRGAALLADTFFTYNGSDYEAVDHSGQLQAWRGYWARMTGDPQQPLTLFLRRN